MCGRAATLNPQPLNATLCVGAQEEEEKKQEEEQRQQLNRINLTVYCGRWERAVAIDKAKTLADLIAQV
eukprot:2805800-Rhodomonas_salina.3